MFYSVYNVALKSIAVVVLILANIAHVNGEDNDFMTALVNMESQFNEKNKNFLSDAVDFDSVLNRAFKQIDVSETFKKNFIAGFKPKAKSRIGDQILGPVPESGTVKLIKTNIRKSSAEGTYRFDFGDNGYGYIRFIIQRQNQSDFQIIDWYDYARGQRYSESLASVIRTMAPRAGIIGKLQDIASNKDSESEQLMKIAKLIRTNDFDGMKKFFYQSDSSLQKNWTLMGSVLMIANRSNDEAFYKDVLASISQHFGNDERAGFILIDYYFYQKTFAKILPILARYEKIFINNDSGILLLKANTYVELKQFDLAHEAALKSIQIEKDFEDGYWTLVSLAISQKNYASAVKYLKSLESQFGYQFEQGDFQEDEFYKNFVLSQEFAKWLL